MTELCIYISKIEILENLGEALEVIPKPDGDKYAMLSLNEKVNQLSLNKLSIFFRQKFGRDYRAGFTRIYFGNETCDRLIPDRKTIERAYKLISEKGYEMTYVTPYTGPEGLTKIEDNLSFLNEKENIEVVFNDWGVLQLLDKKYTGLEPVMGRLMVKMKRDPRFSKSDYSVHSHALDRTDKIAKRQEETVVNSSLEIKEFRELLQSKRVERVGMEMVPYDEDIVKKQFKKNKWGLPIDIYWPWTYITSGRNCQIAAYTQPAGKIHPAGKNCYLQCQQFEFGFNSDKDMLDSVQRGNAVWMDTTELFERYIKYDFDRLIYQPYIPI